MIRVALMFVCLASGPSASASSTPGFSPQNNRPRSSETADTKKEIAGIRGLLERQQADWNRGDIDSFMEGYSKTEELVFTSGAVVRRGWSATLHRYKQTYPDKATMGQLAFSELEITILDKGAAVVLGKWELTRSKDRPHGVFTLVLQKGSAGWKIIHDHTSSAP